MFTPLHYSLLGGHCPPVLPPKKANHSLLHYARKVVGKAMMLQLKQLMGVLQLRRQPVTLYSEFNGTSMAILTNSIDLDQAVDKARGYNIPFMQVVIRTLEGKQTVK